MTGRLRCALAILALLAACADAAAQVLYKWIDKDGKVQYSDRPPKNFSGAVTRLEPDEQPPTVAPWSPKPRPAANGAEREEQGTAPPDSATKRRELRRKFTDDVSAAREKLDGAKTALDAASSPNDDERQVIQQKMDRSSPAGGGSASTGGMLGTTGMDGGGAGRSNCRTAQGNDGKVITTCTATVPNDAFYARVKGLEDAVKAAEEELAAAQQAYRRGVD